MNDLKQLVKAVNDEYTNMLADGQSSAEYSGYIDTGSFMLNAALSGDMYGGFPNNKVLAIAGESSTGKTFFSLGIGRHFLNSDPKAALFNFDTESATTKEMMIERGIDVDRVVVSEPNTIQDFRTIVMQLLENYDPETFPLMMILDSLGNLSTTKELEDSTAGKDTRDMTRAQLVRATFRAIRLRLAKKRVPMIITNHTYESIGSFIPQQIMSGGGGLKYAADQIIYLTKAKERDSSNVIIGNVITCNVVKSRISRENSKVKVLLDYNTGLSRYYGLLDFGVSQGIVKKAAKGFELPDGTKVSEKNALKNPDKYFSEELLQQLNSAAATHFSYGLEQDDSG